MFEEDINLDELSRQIRLNLDSEDPMTPEYTAAVKNLETIEKLKKKSLFERIDPNQVIGAAASLGGIFAVLHYERMGVIASKAFSLIAKIRL